MMVRESKKTMILDAAIQVIEEDGITAVTFDSVAAAAGITRAGIISVSYTHLTLPTKA